MVEAFQIHATLQVLTLGLYIGSIVYARRHNRKLHHRFLYTGFATNTLAIALMLLEARGLPTLHGQLGFLTYLFLSSTVASGHLFIRYRRLTRSQHRAISYAAVGSLTLMILNGVLSFIV
ncbi:MAG: hypothetical protein NWE83_05655 [Candidatus Bathyarchaeota archaeon]|jgi:hypothetical protein|nr:hypothetical protein [Candidatus Bathyarchaeota archaeon]